MKLGRGENILNVGSTAGMIAMQRFAAYGASKSLVIAFCYALRAELAPYGVNVTCLTLGIVQTKFAEASGVAFHRGKSSLKKVFAEKKGVAPDVVARAGITGMYRGKAQILIGRGARRAVLASLLVPSHWLPRLGNNF